jgi:hypothetical protein
VKLINEDQLRDHIEDGLYHVLFELFGGELLKLAPDEIPKWIYDEALLPEPPSAPQDWEFDPKALLLRIANKCEPSELARDIAAEIRESDRVTPSGYSRLQIIDIHSGAAVSHRDIGVGISQVVPVLVSAYGSKQQVFAIEQPELHLHPALQSELGDVFIETALGRKKNTFLIETHSEHIILRILRRIRETSAATLPEGGTPIRPDDVAVLYAKPTDKGTEIIELEVTEDGDFKTDWPGGFFTEREKDLYPL